MPNKKIVELLTALIKKAGIITDYQREKFLEILPSLNDDQLNKIVKFFISGEIELGKIQNEYKKKEKQVYSKCMEKVNEAVSKAKKEVYRTKESISGKKDEQRNKELMEELKKI